MKGRMRGVGPLVIVKDRKVGEKMIQNRLKGMRGERR